MEPRSTKTRLAQALRDAKAPDFMIRKAEAGHYDDFESDSATPIVDLVLDCLATGSPALKVLADEAKQGRYDGTKAEADAWFAREGQFLLRKEKR